MIRIEIECRIPTVRRNLADTVAAGFHILPEGCYVRSVGENGSRAHNRDGAIGRVFHDDFLLDLPKPKLWADHCFGWSARLPKPGTWGPARRPIGGLRGRRRLR